MIEETLINYGMSGIFIAYLIWDRKIILSKLIIAIDKNTEATNKLCSRKKW